MRTATVQEAINGNNNETVITPLRLKQVLSELDLSSGGGGSGGITKETDPIFKSSPAAGITTSNIASWNNKQDPLVSGQSIKTINGQDILGEGDITIESGSSSDTPEVFIGASTPKSGEKVWFQPLGNLFNKNTMVDGGRLLSNGNVHTWNNDCCCSDFIEVQPNAKYTLSGGTQNSGATIKYYNCYYDENKNCIGSFLVASGTQTITTPANAKYIRFTVYNVNKNTFQFEKGSVATEYKPYSPKQVINILNGETYEEFLNVDNLLTKDDSVTVEESDPTVPAHVKAITQEDIDNWNSGTGGNNNIIVDGDGAIISTEESNGTYMWVHNSTSFTLEKESITKIPFDTVVSDTSNGKLIHENGGIRIGKGVKQILVLTKWNNWTYQCQKYVYVYKNGVLHEASGYPTGAWTANVVSYVDVQEGDFIETYGYHNYSSSLGIASNSAQSGLKVIVLSETTNVEVNSTGGGGTGGSDYELPVATGETLGGIKIGSNLHITEDGVLSAIHDEVTGDGSFDPVPINSIFDYEGDVVPEGFVEVEEEEGDLFFYKPGDVFETSVPLTLHGIVTSSTKRLAFSVVLPKRLDNVTTINCTRFNSELRGQSGYINNASGYKEYTEDTNYTITCAKATDNMVSVYLDKSTAYTNVTNNTLVALRINVTFEFN